MNIDVLGLSVDDLEWYQMCTRAIIVFIVALIFIRVSGMRTFGTQSAFDVVVSLTLGAILSRCITGKYPFFSCLAAAMLLMSLHQLIVYLTYKSKTVRKLTQGESVLLFENGRPIQKNLSKHYIVESDLLQAIHRCNLEGYDKVQTIWLEPCGEIFVIKKEKQKQVAQKQESQCAVGGD
jgi:uncharacterized membrane protein YcaP (DUF421 family)